MSEYKDRWNDAYDEAIENGKTDQEAIDIADNKLSDDIALKLDIAKDKRKEQGMNNE